MQAKLVNNCGQFCNETLSQFHCMFFIACCTYTDDSGYRAFWPQVASKLAKISLNFGPQIAEFFT